MTSRHFDSPTLRSPSTAWIADLSTTCEYFGRNNQRRNDRGPVTILVAGKFCPFELFWWCSERILFSFADLIPGANVAEAAELIKFATPFKPLSQCHLAAYAVAVEAVGGADFDRQS
jgi:hypothetical protein